MKQNRMNVMNPKMNNVPNTLTSMDDKRSCFDLRKATRAGEGLCFFMLFFGKFFHCNFFNAPQGEKIQSTLSVSIFSLCHF